MASAARAIAYVPLRFNPLVFVARFLLNNMSHLLL